MRPVPFLILQSPLIMLITLDTFLKLFTFIPLQWYIRTTNVEFQFYNVYLFVSSYLDAEGERIYTISGLKT